MLTEYLRELHKVKLLSVEEEQRLWRQYRERGDGLSRQRIIEAYQPLVFKVVMHLHIPEPWLMDMIQEGTVGLIEAVERYDPDRGIRFSTYAHYRIRGRILNALRRERGGLPLEEIEADLSLSERLADPRAEEELGDVENALMIRSAMEAMERLPSREREILKGTYLEAKEPGRIARDLSISLSHFYRLQKQALEHLRAMMNRPLQVTER
ncbi:MAG: sigma-70 family RNA polymerase sigma factor [Armatimonadota bacterium]|nr:sigma-70 family RNA polymerase sigma factor [Armatimonadota bacterium]MDR5702754.1 sigma-70 family RNA polymerase sigma factor [Armatimonadota bacterium]MDR7435184.1 sigma-70 family RNA polymerase sigma factor [Armatimonadota bacterium]